MSATIEADPPSALPMLMPEPTMRDVESIDVAGSVERAYGAFRHLDLGRSPIVRALLALRQEGPHMALRLDDLDPAKMGFGVLADVPGKRFAIGAIGKFWQDETPSMVVAPEAFAAFDEPGWGKVVWEIRFEPRGTHVTRVTFDLAASATDDATWRRFRRWLRVVAPLAKLVRHHLLGLARRELGTPAEDEAARALPGDERLADAKLSVTQGIHIAAPPEAVWPWLVQMGAGRAGTYAFDTFQNAGFPSAREIVPELVDLAVGDVIALSTPGASRFVVEAIEPGRALVLHALHDMDRGVDVAPAGPRPASFWETTWSFVLEPDELHPAGATRLLVRARADFGPGKLRLRAAARRAMDQLIERRMLVNLKRRVEGTLPPHSKSALDVADSVEASVAIALDLGTPFLRGMRSHYGLTKAEADARFPGDDRIARPRWGWTHAIEIAAPASEVWPWVAQMGQGKAGFYSYQGLENLFGADVENATSIHPEWQSISVGDDFHLHPKLPAFVVTAVEPRSHFVVESRPPRADQRGADGAFARATWLFMVQPLDEGRCRLISRYRVDYDNAIATRLAYGPYFAESVGFVMDRRMLLGVKERAERGRAIPPARGSKPLSYSTTFSEK